MGEKTERRRILDEMMTLARRLDALKVRLAELSDDEDDSMPLPQRPEPGHAIEDPETVEADDPPTLPADGRAGNSTPPPPDEPPTRAEGRGTGSTKTGRGEAAKRIAAGQSRPSRPPPPPPVSLLGVELDHAGDSFEARYAEGESLGEGGMGEVRVHRDRRVGRDVALKKIVADARYDRGHRERFLFEARVQGQLEHPAIVPVYDIGQLPDGSSYFTMKRVKGETLRQIVNDLRANKPAAMRTYSRRRLLMAYQQVCLAVDYAHQRGVIHRDIKPTNIMLGAFGEVSLLDWGVAKLKAERAQINHPENELPEATAVGEVLGTPGYMSPEQAAGEIDLDERTDIFALGAILFEILTLDRLVDYREGDMVELTLLGGYEPRISERFPELDIPPELETVCVAATEHDRDKRARSARDLSEAVDRYLAGEVNRQRRFSLSRKHTRSAISSLGEAIEHVQRQGMRDGPAPPEALAARQRAYQEATKAIALDPDNRVALQTLMRIVTELPSQVSAAALDALEKVEVEQRGITARRGTVAYVMVAGNIALAAALGVKSWLLFLLPLGLLIVAIALAAYVARRPTTDPRMSMPIILLSSVAFALTSGMFGPFTYAPTLCALNVVLFAGLLDKATRFFAIGCGVAAVLLPIVAQNMGLIPVTWLYRDNTIVLLPQVLSFPATLTTVVLSLAVSGFVVLPALIIGAERDARVAAERKLIAQKHQLAELLPEEARQTIDTIESVPPPEPTSIRPPRA